MSSGNTDSRVAPASSGSSDGSVWLFFGLVGLFSIPFWAIGFADIEILPGLPVSALMVAAPVTAAAVLIRRDHGPAGVATLLRRAFDYRRVTTRRWYIPTTLLLPLATLAMYGVMRLLDRPLPDPTIQWLAAPVLLVVFLISAVAEELGWSGYALQPLQQRWGASGASLILGATWSVWRFIPLVQVGRSPSWIARWTLYAMASRVLYTWTYNNTGRSVFAVALFHAMANLSWQLFPNNGSHFDPQIAGLVVTAIALLVTTFWGPRTLTRHASAQPA